MKRLNAFVGNANLRFFRGRHSRRIASAFLGVSMRFRPFAALFAVASVVACLGVAPASAVVTFGANGHSYEIFDNGQGLSWWAAESLAVSKGGYLATLTSQAEQDFVWSSFGSSFGGDTVAYLGGAQIPGTADPAANWIWITGEPWTYANWAPGQPDNANFFPEDFLQIGRDADGKWNDIYTVSLALNPLRLVYGADHYIVEWQPGQGPAASPVPEPATWALFGAGTALAAGFGLRKGRKPSAG
jgi:hypothetical protein